MKIDSPTTTFCSKNYVEEKALSKLQVIWTTFAKVKSQKSQKISKNEHLFKFP